MSDKIIAVVISDASWSHNSSRLRAYGGAGLIIFPDFMEKNEAIYTDGFVKSSEDAEREAMRRGVEKARELGATHIIAICDYNKAIASGDNLVFFSKKDIEKLQGGEFTVFIKEKVNICHHLANAERVLKQYNLKRG